MVSPVIRTTDVSKLYRLGEHTSWGSLRERLVDLARSPFRSRTTEPGSSIWALKDISFDVHAGEAVAIIGRNGAGKSTLLKILSRITHPTRGRVEMRGRVGSLLEVGTGFHPELTGRENVFLNGSILGMSRSEIRRKFDEVVDFAEVGTFIDTPVKRYSSGMRLRLAFSVAAHLEPEVLLIDEVLAVGDLEFQKRCLGRMDEATSSGRTVLFVSHNLASVRRLCNRGMVLSEGRLVEDTDVESAIELYSSSGLPSRGGVLTEPRPLDPDLDMQIVRVAVTDESDAPVQEDQVVESGFKVWIEYAVHRPVSSAYVMCAVTDATGTDIIWTYDGDSPSFGNRYPGRFRAEIPIPAGLLVAGRYSVRTAIVDTNRGPIDRRGAGPSLIIADTASLLAHRGIRWPGVVRFNPSWSTVEVM